MRELKFRIWDGNNKVFCYPDDIELNRGLEYQQYTGLKDRNGVEIYEGDILKWKNSKVTEVVKFATRMCSVTYGHGGIGTDMRIGFYFNGYYGLPGSSAEVIGNIYEEEQGKQKAGEEFFERNAEEIKGAFKILKEQGK